MILFECLVFQHSQFNNGATYRGGIRNGKMHGKGTYGLSAFPLPAPLASSDRLGRHPSTFQSPEAKSCSAPLCFTCTEYVKDAPSAVSPGTTFFLKAVTLNIETWQRTPTVLHTSETGTRGPCTDMECQLRPTAKVTAGSITVSLALPKSSRKGML